MSMFDQDGEFESPEEAMLNLRDAGFNDEEIEDYLSESFESEDVTATPSTSPYQEAEATEVALSGGLESELTQAGFTPEEITQYLETQNSQSAIAQKPILDSHNDRDREIKSSGYVSQPNQLNATTDDVDAINDSGVKKVDELKTGIDSALADGISRAEIRDYMINELGEDSDTVLGLLNYDRGESRPKITPEAPQDYDTNPVGNFLDSLGAESNKYTDSFRNVLSTGYGLVKDLTVDLFGDGVKIVDKVQDYRTIAAAVDNAHSTFASTVSATGLVGEERRQLALKARANLDKVTVDNLIKSGYTAYINSEGDPVVENEDGSTTLVDVSFWEGLKASAGEIGGAIIAEEVVRRGLKGKIKSPVGLATAALGATAVGAFGGKYLDLARDAAVMREKFDTEFQLDKALDSAGGALVLGTAVGAGVKLVGSTAKSLAGMANLPKAIQLKRARKALEENEFLYPEEVEGILEAVTARGGELAGKTETEQYISALVNLDKNGFVDSIARPALQLASVAERSGVKKSVDERTKLALTELNKLGGNKSPLDIQKAYGEYEDSVKAAYGTVKDAAMKLAPDHRFQLRPSVLDPLLEELTYGKLNDKTAESFSRMLEQVDIHKRSRTVADLLDLVQMTNKVKYAKTTTHNSKEKLNSVLNSLRSEVQTALTASAGKDVAKKWSKDFKTMNTHYSKMLSGRKNAIIKVLNKKSVAPQDIEAVLTKFRSSPEVLAEAMTGLSPKVAGQVEMTYFRMLTQKYGITSAKEGTDVDPDKLQALDWTRLSKELQATAPKSAEGKQYKHLVTQFAQIYRADPTLLRVSAGKSTKADAYNSVHSDAENAIKAKMLTRTLNNVMRWMPTDAGRVRNLAHVTSKLLHSPTDAKAVQEAIKLTPPQAKDEFREMLTELQQHYASAGKATGKAQPSFNAVPDRKTNTKFGADATATVTGGRNRNGVSVPTEAVLDISKMPAKSRADLVRHSGRVASRGYAALYDGTRIHFLNKD